VVQKGLCGGNRDQLGETGSRTLSRRDGSCFRASVIDEYRPYCFDVSCRETKRQRFLEELYMADITSAIGGSIPIPNFDDVYPFITNSAKYEGLCKHSNHVGKEFISKTPFVMCVRISMFRYLRSLSKEMSFENGLLIRLLDSDRMVRE
jgi:hypothetical protein